MTERADLKNRWVDFRIADLYHPEPAEVLMELYGDSVLQGRLIELLPGEGPEGGFAVVRVKGVSQPVIVPRNRLLGVL